MALIVRKPKRAKLEHHSFVFLGINTFSLKKLSFIKTSPNRKWKQWLNKGWKWAKRVVGEGVSKGRWARGQGMTGWIVQLVQWWGNKLVVGKTVRAVVGNKQIEDSLQIKPGCLSPNKNFLSFVVEIAEPLKILWEKCN